MTSKSSSRHHGARKINLKCQRCFNDLRRIERVGFLETKILPLFGYYPWECPVCGGRIHIKKQHARKKHSDGESASTHAHTHRHKATSE